MAPESSRHPELNITSATGLVAAQRLSRSQEQKRESGGAQPGSGIPQPRQRGRKERRWGEGFSFHRGGNSSCLKIQEYNPDTGNSKAQEHRKAKFLRLWLGGWSL